MASGTTETCQVLTNTQFVLSGLTQTNLSTINIVDGNGLDVSECFGIDTKIIRVNRDNISLSGECDTSLEITITEGITKKVDCNYISYIQESISGLVMFTYPDRVTLNTHPECCTSLGFTPEIGPDHYYVCRWRDEICVTCCSSFTPTNQEDESGYQIFDFITGGTTTTVPSYQCCYDYGFVEVNTPEGIKCIEEVAYDPCNGLILIEPAPLVGDIPFRNPSNNTTTTVVPTSECCTSLGFNYTVNSGGGFRCYNSSAEKPTFSLTHTLCCIGEPDVVIPDPIENCNSYVLFNTHNRPDQNPITITYIGCGDDQTTGLVTVTINDDIEFDFCCTEIVSLNIDNYTYTDNLNEGFNGSGGYLQRFAFGCERY